VGAGPGLPGGAGFGALGSPVPGASGPLVEDVGASATGVPATSVCAFAPLQATSETETVSATRA
jgi:hypothetical protein